MHQHLPSLVAAVRSASQGDYWNWISSTGTGSPSLVLAILELEQIELHLADGLTVETDKLFSKVDHLVNLPQGCFRELHTQKNFHVKIISHKNFLELNELVTFHAELELFLLKLM